MLGIDIKAARQIGEQYRQDAIIWIEEDAIPELVLLRLRGQLPRRQIVLKLEIPVRKRSEIRRRQRRLRYRLGTATTRRTTAALLAQAIQVSF